MSTYHKKKLESWKYMECTIVWSICSDNENQSFSKKLSAAEYSNIAKRCTKNVLEIFKLFFKTSMYLFN